MYKFVSVAFLLLFFLALEGKCLYFSNDLMEGKGDICLFFSSWKGSEGIESTRQIYLVSTSEIKKFPLTPRLNWFHPIQLICHLALFREALSVDGDNVKYIQCITLQKWLFKISFTIATLDCTLKCNVERSRPTFSKRKKSFFTKTPFYHLQMNWYGPYIWSYTWYVLPSWNEILKRERRHCLETLSLSLYIYIECELVKIISFSMIWSVPTSVGRKVLSWLLTQSDSFL